MNILALFAVGIVLIVVMAILAYVLQTNSGRDSHQSADGSYHYHDSGSHSSSDSGHGATGGHTGSHEPAGGYDGGDSGDGGGGDGGGDGGGGGE